MAHLGKIKRSREQERSMQVLRNVAFRDIGSGGNNDCLKRWCEFQECNHGEAIGMVGCHDGVITFEVH